MENKVSGNATERLFVAVRLPKVLREAVGRKCSSLSPNLHFAKWTHPEDYHITLQFLGDTATKDIPALTAALKTVAMDRSPFDLSLLEWGTFGPPAAPRVLWAGVGGELEKLHDLHRAVTAATLPLGFSSEARPYKPHLTLARKYRADTPYTAELIDFSEVLEQKREHLSSNRHWTVDGFVLYATRMCAIPMYENIENMTFF